MKKNTITENEPVRQVSGDASAFAELMPAAEPKRRVLEPDDLAVPDSLEALEYAVVETEYAGRRASLRQAHLLSTARRRFFANDYKGWLAWSKERFGFEERYANTCLKVGVFLDSVLAPSLLRNSAVLKTGYCLPTETAEKLIECGDLDKLETLASVPLDRLSPMLEKTDPRETKIKDLREKVRAWKLDPQEREKAEKLAAKRAEQAKRLETPAGRIDAAAALAAKAVVDCEQLARGTVNAELVMRAGFKLVEAAVNTYEAKRETMSDALVEECLACLAATTDFLKQVRGF